MGMSIMAACRVSGRELEAEEEAATHSIMNQLIPLQMMDQVAMTTDGVLPRAWRQETRFPRTTKAVSGSWL